MTQGRSAPLHDRRCAVAATHELLSSLEGKARFHLGGFRLLDIALCLRHGGRRLADQGVLLSDLLVDEIAREPRQDLASLYAHALLDQHFGDPIALDFGRYQDFVTGNQRSGNDDLLDDFAACRLDSAHRRRRLVWSQRNLSEGRTRR